MQKQIIIIWCCFIATQSQHTYVGWWVTSSPSIIWWFSICFRAVKLKWLYLSCYSYAYEVSSATKYYSIVLSFSMYSWPSVFFTLVSNLPLSLYMGSLPPCINVLKPWSSSCPGLSMLVWCLGIYKTLVSVILAPSWYFTCFPSRECWLGSHLWILCSLLYDHQIYGISPFALSCDYCH